MKQRTRKWYSVDKSGVRSITRCETDKESNGSRSDEFVSVSSKEKAAEDVKIPKMYRVILHNDDYTSMEFVVEILVSIFNKPPALATSIMLDVHKKGTGVCGVYIRDIAVTKVNQVHQLAKENQFPLKCSYEEV
jgi:ATP-dependent Clp protease adaptor protein ClpS